MRHRLATETGLVGKLIVAWLVVASLFVVLAIDVGSILLARYRTADLAQDVSFAAAETFAETGDAEAARFVALGEIRRAGADARLKRIDVNGRQVTVVLVDRAGTLLLSRMPFTEDLARVTVTDTAAPSGG
jgi:alpha-D-ribose 1-methylphosphonate 5-triphosphate diphosphatase PhnM